MARGDREMRLLQDGVVAALAAIGLTTIIFLFLSAIVHPRRRDTLPATAVVEACGDGQALDSGMTDTFAESEYKVLNGIH